MPTVFPAKAGTHASATRDFKRLQWLTQRPSISLVERWAPACAGVTNG